MTCSRIILAAVLAAVLAGGGARAQSGGNGVYGGYVGSDAWKNEENSAARERVMMDALRGGGPKGGCASLPAGWAALEATVQFPASYAGYPGWVNTAELLPVGGDLQAYLASGQAPEAYVRPAGHTASTVHSSLCAPAGRSYWLIVDSGMQRVAIGRVELGPAAGPYQVTLVAPELNGNAGAAPPAPGAGTGRRCNPDIPAYRQPGCTP